jgi:uncharacterized membrane protein
MGLRFRRSTGLLPGVRLNVGLRSLSASFGIRGAKYTTGTRGRRITVGLPGTGLSYTRALPGMGLFGRNVGIFVLAILVVIAIALLLVWLSSSTVPSRASSSLTPHLPEPARAVASSSNVAAGTNNDIVQHQDE